MGRRGPAPQPTALKLARGNPGKRALPKNEPKPEPPSRLDPPSWLTAEAKKKWRAMAPKLATAGLMTVADVDALARYCDTWTRWRQCCRVIDRGGMTYEVKNQHGAVVQIVARPEVGIARSLAQQLARLEQEFGMTPSARSRVTDGRFQPTPADSTPDRATSEVARFDTFVRAKRA